MEKSEAKQMDIVEKYQNRAGREGTPEIGDRYREQRETSVRNDIRKTAFSTKKVEDITEKYRAR